MWNMGTGSNQGDMFPLSKTAKEFLGERKIHADQIRGGNPQDRTEVS